MSALLNIVILRFIPARLSDEPGWVEDILNGLGNAIGDALGSVWDSIKDSIWNLFFEKIFDAIFEAVGLTIKNLTSSTETLFNIPFVNGLLDFFKQIGWGLFIAGFVIAIFEICLEYQNMHHFNIKRQFLPLLIGLLAVNLFTVLPVALFRFAVTQQSALTNLIIELYPQAGGGWDPAQNAALSVFNHFKDQGTGTLLYGIVLLLVLVYAFVKVFFANLKRGGILFTMIAIGTLYMVSIPRGYTDGFWSWCKQIVALCVTTVLQNILLYLGFVLIAANGSDFLLVGLGVMLSASEVPRVAQYFGLDTSAKANLGTAIYGANTAISVARTVSNIASKSV